MCMRPKPGECSNLGFEAIHPTFLAHPNHKMSVRIAPIFGGLPATALASLSPFRLWRLRASLIDTAHWTKLLVTMRKMLLGIVHVLIGRRELGMAENAFKRKLVGAIHHTGDRS